MTREEEKRIAARERANRHEIAEMELYKGDKCNYSYARIYNTEIASFEAGVEWADNHPKSPWISVKDDLPCNHEELMSAKCETKEVFVLKDSFGNPGIDYMIKENGKWRWFYYNSTKYWMPIPELLKE